MNEIDPLIAEPDAVSRAGEADATLYSLLSAGTGESDDNAPPMRYGFSIGGIALLIPEGADSEVLDRPKVFPLPRAPKWIAGMLNQRGNVVPVIDIAALLGPRTRPARNRRIMLLGRGALAAAVLIDDLPRPVAGNSKFRGANAMPESMQAFARPAFSESDTHWFEFDFNEFFRQLASAECAGEEARG